MMNFGGIMNDSILYIAIIYTISNNSRLSESLSMISHLFYYDAAI